MAAPLLRPKLHIPPVRPARVSRPRLIERLNAGLHRNLTLICAPAGFGKTTLLTEWIHSPYSLLPTSHSPLPTPLFAWLSLDDQDDEPSRFWTYLIAALQTVHADLGQEALRLLQTARPTPPQAALSPLVNQIAALPQLLPRQTSSSSWMTIISSPRRRSTKGSLSYWNTNRTTCTW